MVKVGFGGSCHWCTEAIFQSLKGVHLVEQGWISAKESKELSEAVIVHFKPYEIPLEILVEVHLHTHSCTSTHSMRNKYRSAVYAYDEDQLDKVAIILKSLQIGFEAPIITKALHFSHFEMNDEMYLNYYQKNPQKPFCQSRIEPKLQKVLKRFGKHTKSQMIN